jgi:hypothetical protein
LSQKDLLNLREKKNFFASCLPTGRLGAFARKTKPLIRHGGLRGEVKN